MQKPKLLVIVGPTASGKSALGVYLAKKLGGEVISADSRQVYKGLTIGTGKVTKKEMEGVRHHLLDVSSPKKQFAVSDFLRHARRAEKGIRARKKLPVLVGGTGFYTDAFVGRFTYPDVPPNKALRAKLEKHTAEELLAKLKKVDPRRAKTIEPHHKRRIIRALEIAAAIGTSPAPASHDLYDTLWLGLNLPQKTLHTRIHTRLTLRIKKGMVAEARKLHRQGVSYERMEELGLEYRFLARLLQKEISNEEFVEQLERAIQKYAKRQMQWFARNKEIQWVRTKSDALRLAKKFLSR